MVSLVVVVVVVFIVIIIIIIITIIIFAINSTQQLIIKKVYRFSKKKKNLSYLLHSLWHWRMTDMRVCLYFVSVCRCSFDTFCKTYNFCVTFFPQSSIIIHWLLALLFSIGFCFHQNKYHTICFYFEICKSP